MQSTKYSTKKISNQIATVVFIDAGVENYQQLVNGVISSAEVFVLEAAADGIEQISQVLQQRQDVGSVHIVSHGAPGCLYLGNTQLSLDTFNRYATQLQQWNAPSLLLYGCNVAAGDAGEEFLAKLHQLTGANIAASTTPTGNAALGGNWELEVVLGQQQPLLAFSPSVMAAYEGILNTPSVLSVSDETQYNGSPVLVAPTLTISDPDDGAFLNGATVVLNGDVTGEEILGIEGEPSGSIGNISWEYDVTSGVMTLTGQADISIYESLLRQVTYQNDSATPTTAARDIQFTLGTALYNEVNGNYYDFIEDPNVSWTEAKEKASQLNEFGLEGYLATITSQEENEFIASNKLQGEGWIGASDAEEETVWKWVTGPEAGTVFWQGLGQGQGEVEFPYSNWASTYNSNESLEPNNSNYGGTKPEGEDYGHFLFQTAQNTGQWNDYPDTVEGLDGITPIAGYVVEYGGMAGDPSPLNISGTATVTFDQTNPDPIDPDPIDPGSTQTSTWDFVTRDFNLDNTTDVVAIKKSDTGSGMTEVHIMDRTNNYQSWALQTATVLHQTDNTWDFAKGDANRDGHADILSIKKSGTPNGKTEVHIMNAADNYQSWVLQTGTALHATDDTWDFQAADYNGDGFTDLVGFKKSGTGTNSTEIHILDGASNYQAFSLHAGTALHQTGDNFDFQVGDYDGDGLMDIAAIKKSDTPKGMTEVHVLDGKTNYQTFSLHTETTLHQTPSGWDFVMDDYNTNNSMGVIGLKGNPPTGTNTTEAHILNEDTTYQSWVIQTGTVLHNIAPSSVV
ncbi:DUF4347 domain-containing protein [Microcoleus sp. FACHB-SPT15]|uniref:DUF4347 domain-containing protein n=1 Tax=Microcoleus sp. FACHB-SPT15 TaxID=2692830 RepID=UPI001F55179B|nr:DUF4347 domain-containing protein [Microcoleus sp. FACHB-SPT15]